MNEITRFIFYGECYTVWETYFDSYFNTQIKIYYYPYITSTI